MSMSLNTIASKISLEQALASEDPLACIKAYASTLGIIANRHKGSFHDEDTHSDIDEAIERLASFLFDPSRALTQKLVIYKQCVMHIMGYRVNTLPALLTDGLYYFYDDITLAFFQLLDENDALNDEIKNRLKEKFYGRLQPILGPWLIEASLELLDDEAPNREIERILGVYENQLLSSAA